MVKKASIEMKIYERFAVLAVLYCLLLMLKGDEVKPHSDEAFGLWLFIGIGIMILEVLLNF